jgi:acyl-CoA dehydrogenase
LSIAGRCGPGSGTGWTGCSVTQTWYAIAVDRDPTQGHLASAAKAGAARLAERVTLAALEFFGPGSRLEHPMLDKLARDARAVEHMEGTTNIQRLIVFGGLIRGGFDPAAAQPRSR